MSKSEPLLPDDVRALYEELIAEGGRVVPLDDPLWNEARVRYLLDIGLAMTDFRDPPQLVPVAPSAALERLSRLWHDGMDSRRAAHETMHAAAARLHLRALRVARWNAQSAICSLVSGHYVVSALHRAITHSAERLSRDLVTGPYSTPTGSPPDDTRISGYFPPAQDLFSRGGQCRIVTDLDFARERREHLANGNLDGEEIRVRQEKLPMKLSITDDRTVLLPLKPYGNPCLLIRDRRLVALFAAFFELLWQQAEPWAPDGVPATSREDLTRQRILEALAAGQKDEAIARHLGVSARTVRRHVAQIMRDLGVTTRFAAGVAAVRQGLVTKGAA